MQQHSKPSHSRHFVLPAAPLSGLTIELMVEEAEEPGPLRLTSELVVEVHIVASAGRDVSLVT
jgi:hypothetical protein